MKTNPIFLAVTTLTLAAPAMIHSAQGDAKGEATGSIEPAARDDAPRAGLITVIENDLAAAPRRSEWRVAWKSLTALPTAERERLRGLVRAVDRDRANPARAPHHAKTQRPVVPPRCMDGL